MITLSQKKLKTLIGLAATAGRLDELNRLEGYVPSAVISRRKGILKKQIANAVGKKDEEERSIQIRIEVPEEEKVTKKEKSFAVNLRNILGGNFSKVEEDDDDDVLVVMKSLLPPQNSAVLGKIVTEL